MWQTQLVAQGAPAAPAPAVPPVATVPAVQSTLMANPQLAAMMIANPSMMQRPPETTSCTIYVGNLSPLITQDKLLQFFGASCGAVLHVRLNPEQPTMPGAVS
eukprot:CAMPEP_0173408434 /NCGR_PEP_ID=MMETSP1356-20130122/69753_1 /TAXON_ID=77927 ORGANISM="Hemiselmis virescens, Strain PCC157" /NCGR_SAMPLE_ID=MMETSP1356 /ASSEMBLY_ACC=CAM_ASM_000847 /LENGTH=102 /DNA_ID=CAMNT_0014369749 /DNA_START=26 /DNA_END=331 /DNA_ORIENTATION=+